jgi:hypothetical protein
MCHCSEIFLNPGKTFRVTNYVCHRTHRPAAVGGIVILVSRSIVQNSVSDLGLTHLEATAIQVILAHRTVKIFAVNLSPSTQFSERI